MKHWLIGFSCALILFSVTGHAADEVETVAEKDAEEKSEETEPIPEVLDVYERHAEMYRFELSPYIGAFIGDTLTSSFLVGGMLDFRLAPQLSLGVDFGWTDIGYDPQGGFGQTVIDEDAFILQGVLSVNMPAAFLNRNKVVEADFFTTLGAGILRINQDNRVAGFVGGGMKTYFRRVRWLAMRVEIRNYFSTLPEAGGGSDFTTDLTITAGPTFLIPPRLF